LYDRPGGFAEQAASDADTATRHSEEMTIMDLYDVMRTTHAAREFTDEPLPDDTLYRILDNARFAPSGGNRQGTHITVVRDAQTRQRLAELSVPGAVDTSPR
jgi:nitroreductase